MTCLKINLRTMSVNRAPGPHLIHGSLGPPKLITQMASRSVQPFLQGSRSRQTIAILRVTIGRIYHYHHYYLPLTSYSRFGQISQDKIFGLWSRLCTGRMPLLLPTNSVKSLNREQWTSAAHVDQLTRRDSTSWVQAQLASRTHEEFRSSSIYTVH